MQKKTNIYAWLGLIGATMMWAGCPDVKLGGGDSGDAGVEHEHHDDHDAGTEIEDETMADAGEAMVDETVDAGMPEVDDCTANEAGDEMTDDTNLGWTCAPQEDDNMCFNEDYDWEVRCANETCVTTGELCFRHEASLWYNECLEANSITEYCDNISDHVVGDDSVVIYSIAYVETVDSVASFVADIYSDSDDIESLNQYSALRFVNASGSESGVHDVPTLTAGTNAGHYTLEFELGGTAPNGEYAIFYDNGAKSNAYCFTNANMPSDAWTLANNNDLGDLYEESDDCAGDDDMTDTDGGVVETDGGM